MASRSKRGQKLKKAEIRSVAKTIRTPVAKDLSSQILGEVAKLPQLELYPERESFLKKIQSEHFSEFDNLVNKLCQKYSDMLVKFHGKDSYMKLQINWHDFIRSVASHVNDQHDSDAQVIPEDEDYDVSTEPVTNAWLSLVTSCCPLDKETQFSMLHVFARSIYHYQHSETLKAANPSNSSAVTSVTTRNQLDSSSKNDLKSLIRMCGSQLCRILNLKKKELEKAKRAKSNSEKARNIEEAIQLVGEMCMSEVDKVANIALLPSCDEGGMIFPHNKLFDFLRQFDSAVSKEVNFTALETYGERAFKNISDKMCHHKEVLYPMFAKHFPTYSKYTLSDVYGLLFQKMLNLRKKDMENSWERLKGSYLTLNLRDELKPYASKKEH